MSHVIMSPT